KNDLPIADIDRARHEVEEVICLSTEHGVPASAKTGIGIKDILEAVVKHVPAPKSEMEGTVRALMVDSWYDSYRGAVVLVRVVDGQLKKGMKVRLMATKADYEITELGVFNPFETSVDELGPGEVGFFSASIKSVHDTKVGDTITDARNPTLDPLPGFEDVKPMVFAGIFPTDSDKYGDLRDALEKLHLNDSAFQFEPDNSQALGLGFRCGFLGLLHMEVVQERLEREYELDLVTTAPSVVYHVHTSDGKVIKVENPASMPDPGKIEMIEEPYFKVTIHVPEAYVGAVLKLCEDRRGLQKGIQYASQNRVIITYEMPLAEVLFDFYDKLKSATRGYASMDYELIGYRANTLVRLDMLINGEPVDALSAIVHRDRSHQLGKQLAVKLKEIVPRQQYEVAIQAAIGSRIVARETIRAMRKDVTAKCYGGDISRKRKLLEKQKEGKKRMKNVGRVEIPQAAFHAILKVE
ncbi:MAG TPA: translation elongation factor 4, partial [Polyangiales bacterium]|nr:translation elongation factor 4 [Polyangiales bacterium]